MARMDRRLGEWGGWGRSMSYGGSWVALLAKNVHNYTMMSVVVCFLAFRHDIMCFRCGLKMRAICLGSAIYVLFCQFLSMY